MIQHTGTILDRIVATTRRDLDSLPPDREELEKAVALSSKPCDGLAALSAPGTRIIAEVKRKSPSEGSIGAIADPAVLAGTYAQHGAAAISVLTEPHHFGGALQDLQRVSATVGVPTLRKDFIIDPIQILQARAHGASLILLIAGLLPVKTLRAFREYAEGLGMHALVEAHSGPEARAAVDSGARIVGINNRDLHSFKVDLHACEELRPLLEGVDVAVAESGISHPDHIARLRAAGYRAFLIGTALVRSSNPGGALRAMIDAGET